MRTYRCFTHNLYGPESQGSLGVSLHNKISWTGCRELFAEDARGKKRLFFNAPRKQTEIMAFVSKIEKVARVPVKNCVKFHKTRYKNVLYVSLGDFWSKEIPKSLLTILLRAGEAYDIDKDNWREVIANDEYLCLTKYAINRFISGNINAVWSSVSGMKFFEGWVSEFGDDDKSKVRKILRR